MGACNKVSATSEGSPFTGGGVSMSEWVVVAIVAIALFVRNLDSINIKFRGKKPDEPEEPKQIKYTRPRRQLKK